MSDPSPNDAQQRLIDGTEGIYHVDAGAGTGKTFTITRRYANIVEQSDVEPDDVLLVTFTNSAATEMRERIVDNCSYGMRELADAPIQTFHSYCYDLLSEHGYRAPTHLGIDDRITGSTRIIEDEFVEHEYFREFYGQFRDRHPEYTNRFRVLSNPLEGLELINELASKGVFPTAEGWYRDGADALHGSFESFKAQFDAVNEPRNGGSKQSKLREALSGFGRSKTYLPDAPSKTELRGSRGTKQLDKSVASDVFEADRSELKAFVHDLYFEYLEFALGRNYLNFGFLQLLAFVQLCESPALRERVGFEYVMVDEFQDSSEIQFKLALLLADTDNLSVVGDWKQSIYSFQYADVENITEFETRLEQFAAELNEDGDTRVGFQTTDVERISLTENYRSTQSILDFSEHALETPATSSDSVDVGALGEIESLQSNAPFDETTIEAIAHEDEHVAVLAKVQDIVGNEAYPVEGEDGEPRAPSFGDIAVLTRTRDFGRELLDVATAYDFPMAYDGDVELFRSDPAKLLLAWLRIADSDAERGWAVVLERAGYTIDEIDAILEDERYPENMAAFRDSLRSLANVGSLTRRVFECYGITGEYADVILHLVQSVHDSTTFTRGDLIRFVEQGIENGSTHGIHTSASADSVTVQTIHSAKGLEYPIVILANMNEGRFPPRTRSSGVLRYEESVGVRQRKVYGEDGRYPHAYDNWRYDVYRRCLPDGYDEERRLLYVAITRAEHHVVFAGGDKPNTFLQELPVEIQAGRTDVERVAAGETEQLQLPFTISPPEGPVGYSPHSLMDDSVFEDGDVSGDPERDGDGGMGFGTQVHDFAEDYVLGAGVTPSNEHEERIRALLDGLEGELFAEEDAVLPLEVDGERVSITGVVDLVCVTDDRVEIIDYKTDGSRRAQAEYRKQLSVYYHVLSSVYPDRAVTTSLFYSATGDRVEVEPLSKADIRALVQAA
ncbi:UvrD-helicase domain-containing protein [Haloarcula rara]|uniref:UvrD-helicase domain-containing protein n=1 Tax=Haloarcula rara TaxID=3033387 RepID=UPI0023E8D2DA|nr:UvrD-helicase domain-containing protein [Halomicroarcula sp. SHR3]